MNVARTFALGVAICVALTACGQQSSEPSTGPMSVHRLHHHLNPPSRPDCGSSTVLRSVATLPIRVYRHQASSSVLVNACFGGKGPFLMIVDTGSDTTIITRSLAKRLHLPTVGRAKQFGSAHCHGTATQAVLPTWSLNHIRLPGQLVAVVQAQGLGGAGQPQGTIGADVLSSFASVGINYQTKQMTVAAKYRGINDVNGGQPEIEAPLIIHREEGRVITRVSVDIRGHTEKWLPDTGSLHSVVDTEKAKLAGLPETGALVHEVSLCGAFRVPEVRSGAWALAGHPLEPEALAVAPLEGQIDADGILGSPTLSRYGTIVFDWEGRRLLLGRRP